MRHKPMCEADSAPFECVLSFPSVSVIVEPWACKGTPRGSR